ncbi:peptide ABC transporter substrate-binding protein [Allorhizocola rhizosphaerae]|uniref:peptide ABC transporter substrate-binding protein n=1 Tax=Allorhizocola rhizosphaerae TaxID=1872709 RepID=UPI000E3C13A5|nr:ABC transporter substrate-binding protein [Allorhizocola rhizosphaerae]
MRGKFPMKVAVGATAIALFAAGCQSGSEPEAPSDGGTLRVFATEPAGLMTGANDSPSIQVLRQLYAGLVDFDAKTGAVKNQLAESIESTDNTTWTVKLKKGYKFDNGEDVTADSFIDAWNWVAYGPNAQPNSYFMSHIIGYADTQSEDPDGDGPQKAPEPKSKTMSGLKKVDESTFTVTLDRAFVGFPATVGYAGFYPMAKACLADTKKCNETPIGNGRYKMDGSWKHNVEVKVVRSDSWKGEKGKVGSIVYKIYDKNTTGYADYEAGELDIFDNVPPAKYKDATSLYKDTLFEQASNSFTYLGFPMYDTRFQNVKLRQALSLAIDRQQIIDKIFFGRFRAAEGFVSPNFQGGNRPGNCANCKYDPTKAKALLAEAGGWPGGKLVIWANAGAGHEEWTAVVGDQLKANLGIDYEINATLQFPQYLQTADDKKFTGLFRLGWNPDYPVLETYLAPLYGTGGSSNNSSYANKEFDDFVQKGNAAKTIDEAIKFYQQAEDILVRDLPVLPMWFGKATVLYSKNVKGIPYNTISGVELQNVELNK